MPINKVYKWSYPENNWFFKAPSGYEPTFNETENAVEFTAANDNYLQGNKPFDYSKPFTLSLWVNLKTLKNSHFFNQFDAATDTNDFFGLYYSTDLKVYSKIQVGGSPGTQRTNFGGIISINTWHHILVCFDGSVLSNYVDGRVSMVYSDISITYPKEIKPVMGILLNNTSYDFDGFIDDFEILKHCNDILVNWTGAVLKYSGGEQVFTPPERSGDTTPILQFQANTLADQKILLDGSNNVLQWNDVRNNHVAVQGATPQTYNFTEQAIQNSNISYSFIKHHPDFNFGGGDFYIEFYFKQISFGSGGAFFGKFNSSSTNGSGVGWEWAVEIQSTRFRMVYTTNGVTYLGLNFNNFSSYIDVPGINHIVIVRKDNVVYEIINGFLNTKTAFSAVFYVGTDSLYIGKNPYGASINYQHYLYNMVLANKALKDYSSFSVSDQVFTPKPRNFPKL